MHRYRAVVVFLVLEIAVLGAVLLLRGFPGMDLEVYLGGARALAADGDPYLGKVLTSQGVHLPFTYTPFAAAVFLLGTLTPLKLTLIAMNVASIIGLGIVVYLVQVADGRRRRTAAAVALVAQLGAALIEPVLATLNYGQGNVFLMLAVVADVLVPWRRWPRGVLVGLAAAVKLTPLVFCLFFLLRKDFRSLARTLGTFAGAGAVMWLVAPEASAKYWLHLMSDTTRMGDLWFVSNQSLRGLLARAGMGLTTSTTLVWAALAVCALVLATGAITAALRAGRLPLALVSCAQLGLLVSPVSWTHHWVWCAPAVVLLAWSARTRWTTDPFAARVLAAVSALATILFLTGLPWLKPFPAGSVFSWLGAESYVLFGTLLLATVWWASARESAAKGLRDEPPGGGERLVAESAG
ncbi:glycosyltransferase 87 family protein [Amycolatopsis sp. CA-230715]|uniref:glycosyltransferase 87 family protein n=1 Tax=Amycolatopsis sp. CA-230715 TaxID=2745196 RepID=UPI001C01614E|nr:glycosyltransferase 87 family protein [Amycolatopsis sp. CA-230715]